MAQCEWFQDPKECVSCQNRVDDRGSVQENRTDIRRGRSRGAIKRDDVRVCGRRLVDESLVRIVNGCSQRSVAGTRSAYLEQLSIRGVLARVVIG